MNSITNILKKLRESREEVSGYVVVDNTAGEHEQYRCPDKEAAEKKVSELVSEGSDQDSIEIMPIISAKDSKDLDEADGEYENKEFKEFQKKCMANPTWKRANAICEKYGYKFAEFNCVEVYPSGKKVPSVNIRVDRSKEYNPDIYFYAGKFGNTDPTFEIQTTAYGSLTLEKHAEFLEAVTNAHKMVEELSKIDFMTLYEDELDY